MSVQKNKKESKFWSQSWLTIRKMLSSTAVIALLLPNLVSVGLVAAQELPAEEPAVEEVEETTEETETVDTVEEVIEEETEEVDPAPEAPVEEPVEVAPEPPVEEPATTNAETSELGEPTEVLTLINVRAPQNMENYINTLQDFQNHPLILTNQVTGEIFRTSIRPSDGNTSNHFQLETTVHAYERGNQPSGKYTITLPQELIDLGYSLARDHSVQSNFGIVGMTNLSYNAPQSTKNVGEIARNVSAYDYLTGRDIGITLTTLDGQRTYTLGSRNLALPSGEYNIRITNSPTDTRPQLLIRESSLVNAPEREVELTRDGNAYMGTATLDFTNSTRPQIFKLNPMPLELKNTVTIDPNDGTMDEGFVTTEVDEGEIYALPYIFQSGLQRPGYTLTGYSVEGTLLDAAGNAVTEIPAAGRNYTPMSDVILTANWEVTAGKFTVQLYDDIPSTQPTRYTLKLVADDGTEYPLSSNSYNASRRVWEVENIPNGTYTLLIEGYNIESGEKFGQPDTTSNFVVNDNGTATVELEFADNKSTSFIRYQVYGEPIPETNTVTIDPNGGTINEDYRVTEVNNGEKFKLEYAYKSELAKTGYDLVGYQVEGKLLDANGNEVTEINRFTAEYTPLSDVTLTAMWERTTGEFQLIVYDENPAQDKYNVNFTNEDGTPAELNWRYVDPGYSISWDNDEMPYGTYTLSIEGFKITDATLRGFNLEDPNITISEDGSSLTVHLGYPVNYSAAFSILRVYGEPIPETNTVTIDPNGGTIDENFRTSEVEVGEMYTVPYTFQSKLNRPGYTLTGYAVEGTLLDANGNPVTEISHYTGNYTPTTDVTLTANWEITAGKFTIHLYDDTPSTQLARYTLKLIAEDGTEFSLASNSYGSGYRTWEVPNVPNGTYTLMIEGYNIESGVKFGQPDTTSSFVVKDDGTATVELEFVDDKSTSFIRYQVYGEPIPETNTVTIDPNGGTIDENFRTSEVEAGEMYTVPYAFQSKLNRPGYTLTGYAVEGTLLDANGNPVTEISHYTGNYTPTTDVILTANWEVTRGTFIIQDSIPNYIVDTRTFALTDGENTYPLTSRSYTSSYREWRVENIPNGTYTLLVDGIPYPNEWNFAKFGHPDTTSDVEIKDGVPTFDLTFKDDSTTTFIRYRLSMNAYEIGVEVRDLDNRRTVDVGILVENENGTVFEGTFDQYNLWTTTKAVPIGNYTIRLTTPEGTVAEINDTVASQTAIATDDENVFTLLVNTENKGNLSRVFGAFRLVEVVPEPETDSDHYEPIFVDEIILNLNRGNGKLKNPKTLLENMNHMPGGIKVDYTNLDQLDLSGKTTETQNVEITVTYRDGSTDVAQVPLRVIPK